MDNATSNPNPRSTQRLPKWIKIGLPIAAIVFVVLAVLGSIMSAAQTEQSAGVEVSPTFARGYIASYAGCCMGIPLLLAAGFAGVIVLLKKGEFLPVFLKAVFWIIIVLIPLQLLGILLSTAGMISP